MQTQSNKNRLIAILAVLAVLVASPAQMMGQGDLSNGKPQPKKMDVFINETKTVSTSATLDEVTSSAPDVIKVEKVKGSDTQAAITGLASGEALITLRSGDDTTLYQVNASPSPERLYINIPESKRLTFRENVDEVAVSLPGIVRVQQPSDKVILLEAQRAGKTTITVNCNGEVFRYFVSTFENRGADLLEIQNSFAAHGYRQLDIRFENDQATISGSVPTQEELDDAVRIVKQYTPYVIVKATVGTIGYDATDTEEERVIANNILKIANVKGLIVKVRYPQPTETRSSSSTRVVGAPTVSNTTTDNQTRLTTTNIQLPTAQDTTGALTRPPAEGTIESINRTENYTRPEKIFLFGEVENDLDEAKAIRVARTFCPMIINFCTVRNPIQVRLRTRVLQVSLNKLKDTGMLWTDSSRSGPPSIRMGSSSPNSQNSSGQFVFNPSPDPRIVTGSGQLLLDLFIKGISHFVEVDAQSQIRLLENRGVTKTLQDQSLTLVNGQPGGYFNGSSIPYISGSTTSAGVVSFSTSFVEVGLRIAVYPMNYSNKMVTGTIINPTGTLAVTAEKYMVNTVHPTATLADESVKYVDENGLITMYINTQVSALTQLVNVGPGIQAPQTTIRFAENRATVRNKQSLVAAGLFDQFMSRAVRAVPFFNKIPIFGFLFENPVENKSTTETLVLYTPEIITARDSKDSERIPKPVLPELQQELSATGIGVVPIMKPAKYMSAQVDLRNDKAKKDKPAAVQAEVKEEKPAEVPAQPTTITVEELKLPETSAGQTQVTAPATEGTQQKSSGRLAVPDIDWSEPPQEGTVSVAVPNDSTPVPSQNSPAADSNASGNTNGAAQEAPVTP